jgi:hypothetical protein
MSGHTPGRLTIREDGEANVYHLMTDDGRWFLALRQNGELLTERQREHMRRLAACWNACEGASTEVLEALPFSAAVAEESRRYREAIAQRDELLAELRNIATANPRHWDEETRDQFQEWAQNRARAAIAKVQP